MSEVKFTKGPWKINPLENDKEYIRIRSTILGERFKIANVHDLKFHHDNEKQWCKRERMESIANAHLIAAAPDMYEMLKECLDDEIEMHGTTSMSEKIKTLLAKARGEHE